MITTIDDYSYRCEQKEEGEEPSPQKAITDASTAGLGLVYSGMNVGGLLT